MTQGSRTWALHLAVLLFSAGCGGPKVDPTIEPGTPILVKGLMNFTGPTKENGIPYGHGVRDHINAINAAGGVRNHLIEYDERDYAYDLPTALKIYDEWKADESFAKVTTVIQFGTSDSLALAPKVAVDKKVVFTNGIAADFTSPGPVMRTVSIEGGKTLNLNLPGYPYDFIVSSDYSTGIRVGMQFIKNSGGHGVAFFHCSISFCTAPIAAGMNRAAELGLKIGEEILFEQNGAGSTQADYDTAVQNWVASKSPDVDWVWMGNSLGTTIQFTKSMAQYAPNVKIIVGTNSFDESLPTTCGEPCRERLYGITSFSAYGDTRFPGMTEVVQIHDAAQTAAGAPLTDYTGSLYTKGYAAMFVWRGAVEQVIDSGGEITGESIKNALESFQDFQTGGITSAPLTYTPTDHRPQMTANVYNINTLGKLSYQTTLTLDRNADWLGW